MRNNPLHTDKTLVTLIAGGDESAFATLYNHYRSSVNLFILKFIKSPALAEDLSQEVFLKIWEARDRLTEIHSFKDYLFITTRNHTFNALKQASQQQAALGEMLKNYHFQPDDAATRLLQQEYNAYIQQVLQTLPERTRQVFQLCREQEKSYDEVAALLGITRDAVKKHMVRANKTFKNTLNNNLDLSLALFLLLHAHQ